MAIRSQYRTLSLFLLYTFASKNEDPGSAAEDREAARVSHVAWIMLWGSSRKLVFNERGANGCVCGRCCVRQMS